jgi:hypothetical protein
VGEDGKTGHQAVEVDSNRSLLEKNFRTNRPGQVRWDLPPMRNTGRSADSMEGAQMLRKGLVALMMGVICAGSAIAEQPAQGKPNPAPTGLVGWLKNKTAGTKSSASSRTGSQSTAKPSAKKTSRTASTSKSAAKPGTSSGVAKAVVSQPTPKPATKNPLASVFGQSQPATQTSKAMPVQRAVVNDAERQAVQVRQTSAQPDENLPPVDTAVPAMEFPVSQAETPLQPVPIQQPPVLPNIETVNGPQYFSATPAGMSNPVPVHPSNNWQSYQAPQPIHMVSQGQYWSNNGSNAPSGPVYSGYAQMSEQGGGMYPQTGAALYPAPRPGIPHQVGGIAIENPAFHPHEMLYPHRYKAMYGPYSYKVNGGWMVTPFGVWSHEDWKLQGTTVDVKYKSHISPFTFFKPPVIR